MYYADSVATDLGVILPAFKSNRITHTEEVKVVLIVYEDKIYFKAIKQIKPFIILFKIT